MIDFDSGQGKAYVLTRYHRGQTGSVEQISLNIQIRRQLLRASTAMSCVLAAVATMATLSGLVVLSTAPVLAQQVSGHGGSGGQHAISRPRAGAPVPLPSPIQAVVAAAVGVKIRPQPRRVLGARRQRSACSRWRMGRPIEPAR